MSDPGAAGEREKLARLIWSVLWGRPMPLPIALWSELSEHERATLYAAADACLGARAELGLTP